MEIKTVKNEYNMTVYHIEDEGCIQEFWGKKQALDYQEFWSKVDEKLCKK